VTHIHSKAPKVEALGEISPAIFLFLANWCKILAIAGELQPATIPTGVYTSKLATYALG